MKKQLLEDFLAWCKTKDMRLAGEVGSSFLGTSVTRYLVDEDEANVISDFLRYQEEREKK